MQSATADDAGGAQAAAQLRSYLISRLVDSPDDAAAWRMLGKLHWDGGDIAEAEAAFRTAIELDPQNPAAHFGLAECLRTRSDVRSAAQHFQRVLDLAPGSGYANDAEQRLLDLDDHPEIDLAGFEVKRFDGSEFTEDLLIDQNAWLAEPQPFRIRGEFGVQYNSNVALTPTSRELAAADRSSFQGFVNPFVEYNLVNTPGWRIGPSWGGYFTLNENDAFGALNLQSYQPGVFAERTILTDDEIYIFRLSYGFTLDQFDGSTFSDRHAVATAWTTLWSNNDATVFYWTGDETDFRSDGVLPALTSQDGWTNSFGASHSFAVDAGLLTAITLGADGQFADAEGSDFRYAGGSLYVGLDGSITDSLTWQLEGGWGARDYYDSDLTPSRNEDIWRASARLRKQWNPHWSTSLVFHYDRFDSDNAAFDARRYLTGAVAGFEY